MRKPSQLVCLFGVALLAACDGGPGPLPGEVVKQDDPVQAPTNNEGSRGPQTPEGPGSPSAPGQASSSVAPNAEIRSQDFDQTCSVDEDCVAIFEGKLCEPCKCPNAAIATKAASDYGAEFKKSDDCPQAGDVACNPCTPAKARCDPNSNMCAL